MGRADGGNGSLQGLHVLPDYLVEPEAGIVDVSFLGAIGGRIEEVIYLHGRFLLLGVSLREGLAVIRIWRKGGRRLCKDGKHDCLLSCFFEIGWDFTGNCCCRQGRWAESLLVNTIV